MIMTSLEDLTSRDYRTTADLYRDDSADSDPFTYDSASRMLTAVSGRYTQHGHLHLRFRREISNRGTNDFGSNLHDDNFLQCRWAVDRVYLS